MRGHSHSVTLLPCTQTPTPHFFTTTAPPPLQFLTASNHNRPPASCSERLECLIVCQPPLPTFSVNPSPCHSTSPGTKRILAPHFRCESGVALPHPRCPLPLLCDFSSHFSRCHPPLALPFIHLLPCHPSATQLSPVYTQLYPTSLMQLPGTPSLLLLLFLLWLCMI